MPEMRAVSQCGFHQCGKCPRGGTRLASLFATFACSKCVVAGTHRRYPSLRRGTRRNPRTLARGGGQNLSPIVVRTWHSRENSCAKDAILRYRQSAMKATRTLLCFTLCCCASTVVGTTTRVD